LNRALSLPEGGESTRWDSVSKEAPIPGAKGQSFFIKNLLQNVIFQEAGIAGENRWWELRNRAVMWSGYAALLALLVILGGLWLTSYAKNKAYLEEVDAKVPMLEQQSKALQNQPQRDLFALLPLLNSLVDLPKSNAFDVNDPPVS
ncbi:type VI secretion protein IcmF/TssM N-terminal domain-containing protein, partial [Enterobacter hormaechei subsp. steigerwaltii]|nr:type VI secretion protein IcmF/TssM N-terminal domain-containing protein [Enterobacter hormaechei subsp. steigerwaltii]